MPETKKQVQDRLAAFEAAYQKDRAELPAKLRAKDDVEKYRDNCGRAYTQPTGNCGWTTMPVLEFLKGMPLNNLALAYMHALRPSKIRVSTGCVTCDATQDRITVIVDDNDIIQSIDMSVSVLYSCGAEIDAARRQLRQEIDNGN
jgi:hypothetical protein